MYALHNYKKHAESIHATVGPMCVHSRKYAFWETPIGEKHVKDKILFQKLIFLIKWENIECPFG